MLAIRLFRTGKINQPAFKIVVTDKTRPARAGRFLEVVGVYNPLNKKRELKADRIKYWMSVGAQPSDTVYNLLISEKIISGKKIPSHNKVEKPAEKTPEVAPTRAAPETPAAETPIAETPKEEVEYPKEETPVAEEKPAEEPKKEETPVVEEKPE